MSLYNYSRSEEESIDSLDENAVGSQTRVGRANGNLAKILPLQDVFIAKKLEAMGIEKKDTVEESFRALRRLMPRCLIIIEDGENGVHFSTASDVDRSCTNVPAFKSESVVDNTG